MKIEKGVPIPKSKPGGRKRKYPFWDMEVGESVMIKGATAKSISGSLARAKRATGWKFTTRTVARGVRVWRTE